MRLFAISDVHVGHARNRRVLEALSAHPNDWLLLVGDVGEGVAELRWALELLRARFAQVLWVPGNHELWTRPSSDGLRGTRLYARLVDECRGLGVLTPEDPYPLFAGDNGTRRIAPLFLLYDYSFAPQGFSPAQAVAWAMEDGILCVDEHLLHPDPFPSRAAWCEARCLATERRLTDTLALDPHPLVLVNHFPLHPAHAVLPRIPRFSIWCGTRRSEDWHTRFRAEVVVYGHLHIPGTKHLDGVRFEEVSLGYPGQWNATRDPDAHLRLIL